MMHEISQLDIPDHQLQAVNAPPRVSISREIGEARIIHTMFGKAKVRIIRQTDGRRRVLLLLALAAIAALAAAAWWAWLATQPTEPVPGAGSQPLASEKVPGAQSPLPAIIAPPAAAPAAEDKPVTPPASEIAKPAIIQKSALQPAQNVQAATPMPAQPVAPKPSPASRQQTPPPAPPSSTQTAKPVPPTPMPPRQPAPAVVAPRTTLPARPAASSPATAVPLASPVEGGAASTQTPAAADMSGK